MKPSFTLSFTDDAIQLLHRVGRNWVVIGETPFAAPDLDDALDYMRKTALGLEPGGFTTKLVIPNSQIRYLEVEAPGPSDDERRTQILAALADKTPYAPEELVFDWSGRQKTVRVAAVARETLQEAEGFAVQHRFNPVGFAAIPSEDAFAGEPWFGLTEGAQALIGADQTVERDRIAVRILAREMPKPDPAPDPADAPPTVAEPAAKAVADPPSQMPPETAADAAAETAPETAVPDQAISEKALPEAARDRQGQLDIHEPLSPAQAFALRDQPAGGNAFPESDSDEDTGTAADNQPDAAVGPAEIDADALLAALQPMADAQPPHTEKTEIPQEAPFTHVTEDAAPAADAAPSPKADLMPGSDLIPGGVGIPDDDDIPPAPSDAARVAFASRRSVDGGAAPSLGAAARPDASALSAAARGKPIEDLPPMPRPPQAGARPAAPAAGALRGGMVKGLGALVSTPVAGAAKKVKIKPGPLPPPPTQTPRSQLAAAAAAPSGAADAARSLSRPGSGLGGRPMMPKKSRAGLFLTLVAVLLLCLALIAAWSSFYLGAQAPTDPAAAPEAVAADTTAIPAVEDEMLADGEGGLLDETAAADAAADPTTDAAAVADALADVAAEPAADPAADAGVAPETAATDGPAAAPPIENHDETFLATSDAPPPALDALSLPAPEAAPDGLPTPQMPPPPFGTVYAFDENGMLLPTPEGITSPEGVLLIAGKPPVVPPARSDAAAAAAAAAVAAAPVASPAAPDEALVEALPFGQAPTDPQVAVGVEAGANATATAVSPEVALPALDTAAQPNPDLADRRPKSRPASLVTNPDDAALATEPTERVTSLRPRTRPTTIVAAADRARAETESASLAAAAAAETPAAPTEAEVQLAAATAAEAANPSVVAISRRPAERPKNFNRAVEAAVAAAIRTPVPEPEPEVAPEPQKKPAVKAAAKKATAPDIKPDEQSEIDEPELASNAAPKIPTKASVAKQATYKNAINLSKTNLIGVYGTKSNRYALIRTSNGKYKKVKVGDKIDGGQIKAITDSEVRYQKGGRLIALKMPKT